ncbi:MAG TPA: alpha/beta fold hydrolase [Gemmataceae bacterium]|jgi:poly(3-hydroxyalkanoate) synthetase|nr:alpha/beta fold hydrolase [Gemmataceae bacterium]
MEFHVAHKPDVPAEQSGPNKTWPGDPMLWPLAATRLAMDACLWWMDRGPRDQRGASSLAWTTPNKIALELATFVLRDFSGRERGHPALICAPYALHRALIADFAPGHSIVEALQRGGVNRLYLTDWRSASPDMRYLAIDNYLADLNVAVDEIGPPLDLIGLCQGGWMSLLYAARFPEKVRRLVLVGTPVDISVQSELSQMVARAAIGTFEGLVASGGGLVRGTDLIRLWSASPDMETALQRRLSADDAEAQALRERFAHWHAETLDLPGVFYLETVEKIFRENRLAKGTFVALGRELQLDKLTIPVFLLAGSDDEVVPQAQAMATASLLGTPPGSIATEIAPGGHLGLFIGATTLDVSWKRVSAWLSRKEPAKTSTRAASA